MLLIASLCGKAQKSVSISGVVRDVNGIGLSKATLQLLSQTDTLTTLSGEKGEFIFHSRQGGEFSLSISIQGFKPFTTNFSADPGKQSIVLPPIVLSPLYEDLVPVMVLREKPITILQDTIEYHASAYKVRPGAELERLMKQLPGIDWDTGGNIMVHGKLVSRIMIDGQNFTIASLKAALQYFPVDIIDKVQLIDDYGDQARLTGVKSGESQKVLNIVLKKDRHNGEIVNLQAGIGGNNNYKGELFTDVFKGTKQVTVKSGVSDDNNAGNVLDRHISLGYADAWNPKWSVNSFIFLEDKDRSGTTGLVQNTFLPGNQVQQQQNSSSSHASLEFGLGYSLNYLPDSNTLLRIGSSFSTSDNNLSMANALSSQEQDSGFLKTTTATALNTNESNSWRVGSNIYFERTNPGSKNRLTFDFSYQDFQQRGNGKDSSTTHIVADSSNTTTRQQYALQNINSEQEVNGKLHDYIPLQKGSLLELGYDWDYSQTHDSRQSRGPVGPNAEWGTIDSLSTDYSLNVTIQKLYAGYLVHTGKLNLNLGLDGQPGLQSGTVAGKGAVQHDHYFDWLPQTQASFAFSSRQKLNVEYQTYATLPTLQQSLPVIDIRNPQYPVQGNPNLRPSYTQSLTLRYEQSSLKPTGYQGFGLGLIATNTQSNIVASLTQPRDTSSIVEKTTYTNLNGFNTLNFDYHLDLPAFWQRRIRVIASGNFGLSHTTNLTDSILYKIRNLTWNQSLQINLNIPEKIESSLWAVYQSSLSRYAAAGSISPPISSFSWGMNSRYTFFQKWVFTYTINQTMTTGAGSALESNPVQMNAVLRRDFLSNNQVSLSLSMNNIFNQNSSFSQSTGPTSFTQSRTALAGRYFLVNMIVKFEKFKHQRAGKSGP
jgi:hypothetical protein